LLGFFAGLAFSLASLSLLSDPLSSLLPEPLSDASPFSLLLSSSGACVAEIVRTLQTAFVAQKKSHLDVLLDVVLVLDVVFLDILLHSVQRLCICLAHFLDLILVLRSVLNQLRQLHTYLDVEPCNNDTSS
jgi:hypothetical protein